MNRVTNVAILLGGLNVACGPIELPPPPAPGAAARESEEFHGSTTGPEGGLGGMGGEAPVVSGRPASTCNDGVWDDSEVCDPSAGGFESCEDMGFEGGEMRCTESCNLDVSGCFFDDDEERALNICGDGFVDDDEECDDDDDDDEDGCRRDCTFVSSEHEPNNTDLDAEDHKPGVPFFGVLTTGDEDWLRFSVEHAPGTLIASIVDLLPEGCADAVPGVNPALELLDTWGDPVAWDSDGGLGECPLLDVGGLAAGTYYIRILGEMSGSFPYVLDVAVD